MWQPGQRQLGWNPPSSEIAYVIDAGPTVIVVYTDGTRRPYPATKTYRS